MTDNRMRRGAAIGWAIIILIGCVTPGPDIPPVLTWNDKFMHIAIFIPFGMLWVLAGYRLSWVLLAGLLYGGFIEIMQAALPIHRTGDVWDAIADFAGTVVGVGLAWGFGKLVKL